MPYTLLYVRIFRGNGTSLSENFQFLNGLNDSKVPTHRILRRFFGYLPAPLFWSFPGMVLISNSGVGQSTGLWFWYGVTALVRGIDP